MTAVWQNLPTRTDVCSHTTRTVLSPKIAERWFVDKLPPEHRKKPRPLDITSRAEQVRFLSTYSASSSWDIYSRRCSVVSKPHATTTIAYEYDIYPEFLTSFSHRDGWIQAIRNKLQSDKVSFADTIGEWRETVGLFGSAVRTLSRAVGAARRVLKGRGARRTLKRWFRQQFGRNPNTPVELVDAVSLDLAIKFGIKPTLNQIWDTLEALGRVSARKRRLQVSTVSEARQTQSDFRGVLQFKSTRKSRCVIWVTYDLESSNFTAGNLAEALWAGTTMSFVIDWFIDVGGYLSSFNAMNGVSSFVGFVSHKEKVEGTDTRKYFTDTTSALVKAGTIKWERKKRIKLTSLPFADPPTFKLPSSDLFGRLTTLMEILYTMRANRR